MTQLDRGVAADERARLDEVLVGLARRWRLVLLVALPAFLGILGYASTLPTTWTATATIGFAPRPSAAIGADTITLLVPNYVAYVRSPAVEDAVGQQYGADASTLDRTVNVAVPPTTATIVIRATESTSALAANLANGLARSVVSHSALDPILTTELAAEAVPPVQPSGPRRRLLQLFGLIGSLLLGALVAGVVERGFPRVRSAADVRAVADQEVLGLVPRSGALRHLGGEALDDAVVGVAVRTLRLQLELAAGREASHPLVLAVCSADRGEGRSSVIALLAHAFARVDMRVLVIDADVARCQLTEEYCLDLPAGGLEGRDLVGVLEERVALVDAIRVTGVPNLSLLPCSPVEGVSDLFARRMGPLLRALRAMPAHTSVPLVSAVPHSPSELASTHGTTRAGFDIVLVDTPPLRERDEAALLAGMSDGVLLVADHGRQVAGLRLAVASLHNAGAHLQGVVINRVPLRSVALGAP